MLPYANAVAIFTISGQVLIDAVRNGLSLYPNGGRFLQASVAACVSLCKSQTIGQVLVDAACVVRKSLQVPLNNCCNTFVTLYSHRATASQHEGTFR
jgi:hypothetical protein